MRANIASFAAVLLVIPSVGSGAKKATTCPHGQELVGDKCLAKCPAGMARKPGGTYCVPLLKPMPACNPGEESINGTCVAPCPDGTVREPDGLACITQA